jgi:hypothetical protein
MSWSRLIPYFLLSVFGQNLFVVCFKAPTKLTPFVFIDFELRLTFLSSASGQDREIYVAPLVHFLRHHYWARENFSR